MDKLYALGKEGKQLWTREWARRIRAEVEALLDQLAVGEVLVIDAKGVEVFDFSFANELFGKLAMAIPQQYPGRFLVVEHLTDYTRENLTKALESLNLAMIERKGRGGVTILGKVHPVDQQTIEVIARAKDAVTAATLKEKLNINLNAMNERLGKLVSLGLLRRDKAVSGAGREQYEYRLLS